MVEVVCGEREKVVVDDVTWGESDFVLNLCRDQTSGGGSFVFNCYRDQKHGGGSYQGGGVGGGLTILVNILSGSFNVVAETRKMLEVFGREGEEVVEEVQRISYATYYDFFNCCIG